MEIAPALTQNKNKKKRKKIDCKFWVCNIEPYWVISILIAVFYVLLRIT